MMVMIDWNEDAAVVQEQVLAAREAVFGCINEGEVWELEVNGNPYAVKRGPSSVRIYVQEKDGEDGPA